MNKNITKSIGIGLMLILSIVIIISVFYSKPPTCTIEEPHYHDHDGELYYTDTINRYWITN